MHTHRSTISRSQLAQVSLSALAMLCLAGCGGADVGSQAGDEAFVDTDAQALRARRPASNSTATDTVSSPSYRIDPVTGAFIVHGLDPNVDPNSGVRYNDLSNTSVDNGGPCADNRAMSGSCPSYGVQCVYDEANVTHYCTCLFSNSSGIQGWECR